jgi:hypothetical protein
LGVLGFDPLAIGGAQGLRDRVLATCTDRAGIREVDQFASLVRRPVSAEDGRDLIRQALVEWERGRMSAPCAVAFGRKTLGTARPMADVAGPGAVRANPAERTGGLQA